ncbi:MAG: hypothetical protein JL50_10550 [Peptococcaceae bacterium BICA1-7]|nr:MAG: hypothetical protein JL50_10550 [Peptococcaceae bacterium BICA1-7]
MKGTNRRLVWALTILVFFFLAAAARIWYIQVHQGEYYTRMALAGETMQVSLEDYPRGRILDRNLVPLTGSYSANRVVVFPQLLEDPGAVAGRLAALMGVEPAALKTSLSDRPVVLPYPVSGSLREAVEREGLNGVVVAPYSFRYGPRVLAAHVVGHLGRIEGPAEMEDLMQSSGKIYRLSDWTGRQGLEYFYEEKLKGNYPYGFAGICTDARGGLLPGLPALVNTGLGDSSRSDIVTTIDSGIQDVVERVMDRSISKGAVVVMDTASGDILAMSSRPNYNPDPAILGHQSPYNDERFINQAVSLFQPGSVFKVVVAAAALSEGVVKPETLFYCRGAEDSPLRCWKPEGHGRINFSQAFAQSCNPVFVSIGQDLGADRLIAYARRMGLDSQSVLGFPLAPDTRQNLDLIAGKYNLANSSIGQGPVLATPLQITVMTNIVASGGLYMEPRLVKEILRVKGRAVSFGPADPVRALSPETAGQLGKLMAGVTGEGVGQLAWVARGGSAGKTGSAEVAGEDSMVNAWFSGYTPLDKPRYTITVLVREGVSGAASAAPVFREIAEGVASARVH